MNLNIPDIDSLKQCDNLLIAGMGGGFDIFCGLPIYFELVKMGKQVHLANFSFSNIEDLENTVKLTDTLAEVTSEISEESPYFPEKYLSEWFKEKHNKRQSIWCFHKTGAMDLVSNYQKLIAHLSIDGILLIDGGVDSLIIGDEKQTGSLIEDALSLLAVNEQANLKYRGVGCVSFGSERDLSYGHILENIANLTKKGGFKGSCSLVKEMESYKEFESAVLFVQAKPYQDPSVINSSLISAVQGEYGNYHLTTKTRGSQLWISPLMPIYWFFDFEILVNENLYLNQLQYTTSFMDAMNRYLSVRSFLKPRGDSIIPLN